MKNINAAFEIERLLQFAKKHSIIEALDVIPSRNSLLDLLQLSEPFEGDVDEENLESAAFIIDNLLDYAAEKGLLTEDSMTYRDLFDARIMGLLMPRESEVARKFSETAKNSGIQKATDDFYALSQASNYIRMDRISKNLYWLAETEFGNLEITINLSKPEKDPKEIAASRLRPQSNYPKCLLCLENVGFAGHINHPARQNHRVIPVTLGGEPWYFQYSPYVYYNEHCILFHEKHVPMKISEKSFERLFDFVEQFPHYFIGSNADLPIVGGSILSHDHFQGGHHVFPMEEAETVMSFSHEAYPSVKASIVKWPLSVIRLSGNDKVELKKFSVELLEKWKGYSDENQEILAFTETGSEKIPHNTITPIARKNKAGEFEIDLVLRNNRTSDEHPDGIFHPHKELHHIKKENIGLIEVMGLAVLPARLSVELKDIENILTGKADFDISDAENALHKHGDWIQYLTGKYSVVEAEAADKILKYEVGQKFRSVLLDAGVYKSTEKGLEGFVKFMSFAGFIKK